MSYRVVVDRDLCQGHGVCESEAPEVFSVSRKGDLTVVDETPPDELRPKVELAVKYCPTHALSIAAEPQAEQPDPMKPESAKRALATPVEPTQDSMEA